MGRLTGVLGILAILLFAYLFSTNRKAIRLRTVVIGLGTAIHLRHAGVASGLRGASDRRGG